MRPWLVWTVFLALVVVLAVAGLWFGRGILELEETRRQAQVEERVDGLVSRALSWMEYAAGSLVLQEAARDPMQFVALRGRDQTAPDPTVDPGRSDITPSDLLGRFVPHVQLHFQLDSEDRLTSPQVPSGAARETALRRGWLDDDSLQRASHRLSALQGKLARYPLRRALVRAEERVAERAATGGLVDERLPRAVRSLDQWRARRDRPREVSDAREGADRDGAMPRVEQGLLHAFWTGDLLLLARQVVVDDEPFVQGCWLDWDEIKRRLLADIRGLLPNAGLTPLLAEEVAGVDERFALTALPIRLVPGPVPPATTVTSRSPIVQSLIAASLAVSVAVLAVFVLLRVILRFSARRAQFVSTVTHELRTPLTTLRMYADLLAEGRVRDEAKRQRYYETLRKEADRLGLLVENVLAYSRLEASRADARREIISVDDLLGRVVGRCRERVARQGWTLDLRVEEGAGSTRVAVDPPALEQVLFNLVDNACKYAVEPSRPAVDLEVSRRGDQVELRVRDYGPGLSAREARRVFLPFTKAAGSSRGQPGVGLGLALCRRLAREMGADLSYDATPGEGGAAFRVRVPVAAA